MNLLETTNLLMNNSDNNEFEKMNLNSILNKIEVTPKIQENKDWVDVSKSTEDQLLEDLTKFKTEFD